MKKINTILSSRIFIFISAFVGLLATGFSYYRRRMLRMPFKGIYYLSLIMLLLSFICFLFSYRNKEAELKPLIRQSVPGYIFFLAFILITAILRG